MIKYYAVNGEIVPKEKAVLGVGDLAIQRGYGLFDFFLVKKGRPLFLEDYLDRVYQSAQWLHLEVPVSREELRSQVLRLIEANGELEAGIKLIVTGGYSEDGYAPAKPNLVIIEMPPPAYPPSKFEEGVKLMLHDYHRTFPAAKTINYLVGIYLLPQQKATGAEDVLFHSDGQIFETTRANFFIVTDQQTIVTAGDGILYGVTRKKTLELARRYFAVEERCPTVDELRTAQEAFITSSTRLVMPVVQVDDMVIGSGRPGPVTRQLMDLVAQEVEAYLDQQLG